MYVCIYVRVCGYGCILYIYIYVCVCVEWTCTFMYMENHVSGCVRALVCIPTSLACMSTCTCGRIRGHLRFRCLKHTVLWHCLLSRLFPPVCAFVRLCCHVMLFMHLHCLHLQHIRSPPSPYDLRALTSGITMGAPGESRTGPELRPCQGATSVDHIGLASNLCATSSNSCLFVDWNKPVCCFKHSRRPSRR